MGLVVLFFKQKTAYERRISDWSSDVCSSDLQQFVGYAYAEGWVHYSEEMMWDAGLGDGSPEVHIGQLIEALLRDVRYLSAIGMHTGGKIGRASCRERVCQYV